MSDIGNLSTGWELFNDGNSLTSTKMSRSHAYIYANLQVMIDKTINNKTTWILLIWSYCSSKLPGDRIFVDINKTEVDWPRLIGCIDSISPPLNIIWISEQCACQKKQCWKFIYHHTLIFHTAYVSKQKNSNLQLLPLTC